MTKKKKTFIAENSWAKRVSSAFNQRQEFIILVCLCVYVCVLNFIGFTKFYGLTFQPSALHYTNTFK